MKLDKDVDEKKVTKTANWQVGEGRAKTKHED